MGSKRKQSRGKKINPHFWVFCEGETEEAYVRYLRSEFRLPVEIIPKIAGYDINNRYIQSFKKGQPVHEKDMNFLMYDADVPDMIDKLKKIDSTKLIASNPSVELWFLMHYKNQTAEISTDSCIKELSNRNKNEYKKGVIDEKLKFKLKDSCKLACVRSSQTKLFDNPSTNMHDFIRILEQAINSKI